MESDYQSVFQLCEDQAHYIKVQCYGGESDGGRSPQAISLDYPSVMGKCLLFNEMTTKQKCFRQCAEPLSYIIFLNPFV